VSMKVSALAPWFGSNRSGGHAVGELLDGCRWVGVPFAGSMAEIRHLTASAIVVNDLHRDIINLARVVSTRGRDLTDELEKLPFHPDVLLEAQNFCRTQPHPGPTPDFDRAKWYFVSQWMGRSGNSGTDKEFTGKLPVRWSASGGDSNTRYRSAVQSVAEWGSTLSKCNFTVLDAFEFLGRVKDEVGHGLYVDPPWPDAGDVYSHKFTERMHRDLESTLSGYTAVRVVVRLGYHPLVRELYDASRWQWNTYSSRTQANTDLAEVLLVLKNDPSTGATV